MSMEKTYLNGRQVLDIRAKDLAKINLVPLDIP